jgi:hypothetical protein
VTRGEARRVAALVEEAVRPGGELPAVRDTDAVAAFDSWLRAAPRLNRLVLRGLLRAPASWGEARAVLLRLAAHCYSGDPRVMRALGYDADAVVARAASLRAAEGRP